MKIISPGIIPEVKPLWPIGFSLTCSHCKCVFVLDKNDPYEGFADRYPGRATFVPGRATFIYVKCPMCLMLRQFNRPQNIEDNIENSVIQETLSRKHCDTLIPLDMVMQEAAGER